MKFFEASVETVVIRYYLMMAAVIIPFVVGVPALAIIALPIFLSALMGIKFNWRLKIKGANSDKRNESEKRAIVPNYGMQNPLLEL